MWPLPARLAAQVSMAQESVTGSRQSQRGQAVCARSKQLRVSSRLPLSPLLIHRGPIFMVTSSFSETLIYLCLIVLTWASNAAGLFLGSFPLSLLPAPLIPSQGSPSLNFSVLGLAAGRSGLPGGSSQ